MLSPPRWRTGVAPQGRGSGSCIRTCPGPRPSSKGSQRSGSCPARRREKKKKQNMRGKLMLSVEISRAMRGNPLSWTPGRIPFARRKLRIERSMREHRYTTSDATAWLFLEPVSLRSCLCVTTITVYQYIGGTIRTKIVLNTYL